MRIETKCIPEVGDLVIGTGFGWQRESSGFVDIIAHVGELKVDYSKSGWDYVGALTWDERGFWKNSYFQELP